MGAYLSTPVTEKEMFDGEGQTLRFGGGAMQGWRKTMEDAHIAVPSLNDDPSVSLFGVFDGHGGGEVAKFCQRHMPAEITSLEQYKAGQLETTLTEVFHRMDIMLRDATFAEEIEQLKTKESPFEDEDGEQQDGAVMDAFEMLRRVLQLKKPAGEAGNAKDSSSSSPMEASASNADTRIQAGCTAVVALKKGNELYVANAGDSRGVLSRNGRAVALSDDHKPAHDRERTRIINAGGFVSEIGGVTRVNGNLNLSRAIGDLRYKNNTSLPAKDQIISADPDIRMVTLGPEDKFFVLACDGVWDVMTNQEVVDFVGERLAKGMTPKQVSAELLDACLAEDPKEARGIGCDNMTVVIVQLAGY